MGMFKYKDDFGYMLYKKKSILFTAVIVFILAAMLGKSTGCYVPEDKEISSEIEGDTFIQDLMKDTVEEPLVIKVPIKLATEKVLLRYVTRLEYKFSTNLYNTCYTGYDPGDPGHGKYANQKYAAKLHLSERRIRRNHWSAALPPEYKQYHEQLFRLPDGRWTHKFRVHIKGVNKDVIGKETDSDYFCVPRDRMKQKGRIDFLITTAGNYMSRDQRVANWKSINRDVEFWEFNRYAIYSDGSEEEME